MLNAQPIQLRKEAVYLNAITIGEIMEIAKIPEALNELRINSFIGFTTKDNTLARRLTVQERYFILLNWLMVSESSYSMDGDMSEFFIPENTDIPEFFEQDGVYVHHLLGSHVTALQHKCENAYEWLACQMACQLSGDLTAITKSDVPLIWEALNTDNDNDISTIIQQRFDVIAGLLDSDFANLHKLYSLGDYQLRHLVQPNLDNDGITLANIVAKGGDSEYEAVRFRPLAGISDIARQLADCFA